MHAGSSTGQSRGIPQWPAATLLLACALAPGAQAAPAASLDELNRRCDAALAQARYQTAGQDCSAAASLAQRSAPGTLAHATALGLLSQYLSDQGRYLQAEEAAQQALTIAGQVRGIDDAGTLPSLRRLALVKQLLGRFDQAEQLRLRILGIEARGGDTGPGMVEALGSLALLYQDQHRYAEAQLLFERALAIVERSGMGASNHAALLRQNVDNARAAATRPDAVPYPTDRHEPERPPW